MTQTTRFRIGVKTGNDIRDALKDYVGDNL